MSGNIVYAPYMTPERLAEIEKLAQHTYDTATSPAHASGAVIVLELVREIRALWAEHAGGTSPQAPRDTSPSAPRSQLGGDQQATPPLPPGGSQ